MKSRGIKINPENLWLIEWKRNRKILKLIKELAIFSLLIYFFLLSVFKAESENQTPYPMENFNNEKLLVSIEKIENKKLDWEY